MELYCWNIEKRHTEFERQFEDIQKSEGIIRFMSFPFSEANNIENISTQIKLFF